MSIQYIINKNYQRFDGGISTVVWMPKTVKDRVSEFLPQDLLPKIATEEDVTDINDLKKWLEDVDHPIVKTWAEVLGDEEEEEEWEAEGTMVPMGTQAFTVPGVGGGGGFKIILKNCKIHAESIIIKKIEPKRKTK